MDDPDTLNREGYQLYLEEKYEESRRKYDSALRLKENFPEALYNRGLIYQQLEDHNKAIQDFSRAIEISRDVIKRKILDIDPNCAYYFKWIGNCYYSLRNYEEALKYYKEGLRIKPEYAEIHYDKGVVLAAQGEYKASIECYETALRYNPDCYLAHINKSYMLYILERYREALEACDQCLEALETCDQCLKNHNNYKYVLSNKGIILLRLGDYREAIKVLDKAVKLYPTFDEAWYQKGSVHFFLEEFDKAKDAFETVIRLNKNFVVESWGYKGVIFAKLNDQKKAEEAFSNGEKTVNKYIMDIEEIKKNSSTIADEYYESIKKKYEKYRIRLLIRKCFAFYLFDKYEEALKVLKPIDKTLTTDRTCVILLKLKKIAFERLVERSKIEKNLSETLSYLDETLSNLKSAKVNKSKIYYVKGRIHGTQGHHRDSVKCFKKALKENPAHFSSMNELGITLHKCGKPYQALDAFEGAIQNNPNHYEAWINKALVLRGLLKYKDSEDCFNEAKKILRAALDLNENYSVANYHMGLIHYEHQEYKEAIESFEKASRSKDYYEDAETNKGLSLLSLKRYDEAIYVFDKIIDTKRNNKEVIVNSLNNKGTVLLYQKKWKVAHGLFKKAAEIDSSNAEAKNNLGLIKCCQGKYEDSLKCFNEAIIVGSKYDQPLGNIWYNKGLLLYKMKKFKESEEAFDKSIDINPGYTSARKSKGVVLCKLDKCEEALRVFKEASLIRPNEGKIHVLRASTLLRLGDVQKAYHEINEVFKNPDSLLRPGNIQEADGEREKVFKDPLMSPYEKSNACSIKGQIEIEKLNYGNAIACFEKAIYFNPSDSFLSVWNAYARYLKAEFLISKRREQSQKQSSEKADSINKKYQEEIISIIRDLEKVSFELDRKKKNISLSVMEREQEEVKEERLTEKYLCYLTGYLYYKINDFYSALGKLQKCISLKSEKNSDQPVKDIGEPNTIDEPAKKLIYNIWDYQIKPPFWRWWLSSPMDKEIRRKVFGATSILIFIALFPEFTNSLVSSLIEALTPLLPASLKGLKGSSITLVSTFFSSITGTIQYIILTALLFILLFPSIEHIKGKDLEIKLNNSPPFINFCPLTPNLPLENSAALGLATLGQIKKRPKPLEIHEIRDQTSLDVR